VSSGKTEDELRREQQLAKMREAFLAERREPAANPMRDGQVRQRGWWEHVKENMQGLTGERRRAARKALRKLRKPG